MRSSSDCPPPPPGPAAPFAEGATFGETGAYERLTGTAYFEVDPNDPLNAVIVDLDLSPRNARGRVEFSTPFMILKPVEMQRSNRKIFYAVNNRGNNLEGLVTATTAILIPVFCSDACDS